MQLSPALPTTCQTDSSHQSTPLLGGGCVRSEPSTAGRHREVDTKHCFRVLLSREATVYVWAIWVVMLKPPPSQTLLVSRAGGRWGVSSSPSLCSWQSVNGWQSSSHLEPRALGTEPQCSLCMTTAAHVASPLRPALLLDFTQAAPTNCWLSQSSHL